MKNEQHQAKKNFSLTSILIIAVVFFVIGAIVRANASAVAGDLLSTVGDIFLVIWIVRGILYVSRKNKKGKLVE